MKSFCLAMLLVLGLDSMAQAFDIPIPGRERKPPVRNPDAPPKPDSPSKEEPIPDKPEETTPMEKKERDTLLIRIDSTATQAKLVIPEAVLRRLQSEREKSGAHLSPNSVTGESILGRVGTAVGGILLTLSLLFGGLWLLRQRKLPASNLAVVAFIVSLSGVGTATLLYANSGPPSEIRSLTAKIFSSTVNSNKHAYGVLTIEVSKKGESLQLIVPDAK